MRWRVIDTGASSADYNMALDEAIALIAIKEEAPPALRFYCWQLPSLTIGAFQKTVGIDLDYCRSAGISVVRRPTGGRAILHGDELTYSFSARHEPPFSTLLLENYRLVSHALLKGLVRLGVSGVMEKESKGAYSASALCFQARSFGEVSAFGLKLIGSAQKRFTKGFLQQGSIPFSVDVQTLGKIIGECGNEVSADALRSILPDIDYVALKKAIVEEFEAKFGSAPERTHPSEAELELAQALLETKYRQELWNLKM